MISPSAHDYSWVFNLLFVTGKYYISWREEFTG